MDFEFFWKIVEHHGSVARFHRSECEYQWKNLSEAEQQEVCDGIERKLQTGRFVHYNPAIAMRDNAPKAPRTQIITADEYYRRYGTQANQDGWVRTFLPDQQKTIYIKTNCKL